MNGRKPRVGDTVLTEWHGDGEVVGALLEDAGGTVFEVRVEGGEIERYRAAGLQVLRGAR